MKNQSSLSGVFALAAVITLACGLEAQAPPASADSHPVVESYYKMVPGKADEWLELYRTRSEEHTSELQSQSNLVCRLLLEKKNKHIHTEVTSADNRLFDNRMLGAGFCTMNKRHAYSVDAVDPDQSESIADDS